ncbi:MAG TPA: hypothetical protein VLF18_06675 [Tahibacter sp.]|uniref:hypothetical protein n=1 Tax=Tahibacter sp. TaxID=2056211 RepID=UPI002BE544E7|nr:hypothetical protein [Tahibacter sp.]HSX59866.1 hypothetical protein [Tahibacter sp.]
MKIAGAFMAGLLAGAAHAAPDPAARARMAEILREFDAISTIDIGNCDHEHPAFSTAYRALTDSPNAVAMQRVLAHFDLKSQPPASVEHNPTADQCLAALDQAKGLFERHGDYIRKLAAELPPTAAAD